MQITLKGVSSTLGRCINTISKQFQIALYLKETPPLLVCKSFSIDKINYNITNGLTMPKGEDLKRSTISRDHTNL